jgi:NAD(P)-dependent dehydrogenase (short-subunit alcohol dehydrogenase family)
MMTTGLTPAGPGIRRLHHVGILTHSIDQLIEHYVALLGVDRPEVRAIDRPGMKLRTTMVATGPGSDTYLQLIEPEVGPGVDELARGGDGTLFELAFAVDDISTASEAFRSNGTIPTDMPGSPIDSAFLTALSGSRYFYLPREAGAGTRTEIFEPVRPVPTAAERSQSAPGEFAGQVALVTGGASGIGEAVVQAFVTGGARVAILDLQQEAAERLADQLGGPTKCIALQTDVTAPDAVRSSVAAVIEAFGTVDIAVNCAGLNRFVAPEAIDDALWHRLIAINLDGPWNVCSAVMPEMIRRGSGRIVNVSSAAGVLGIPKAVPYSAAKHGVIGLTRALAIDLGPYGITVNCVAPGTTLTPLVEAATSETFKAEATKRTPLARLGTPADLANAILFLSSDRAAWISGVVLPVDGGMTAGIRAHHWE